MNKKIEKSRARYLFVGSGNFFAQIFFVWVFKLAIVVRKVKDLKDLGLLLRKSEKTVFNDEILDKKWKEEIVFAAKQKRFNTLYD